MSRPDSMIVVQTRMSCLPAAKSTMTRARSSSSIWPWPIAIRARGTSFAMRCAVDRPDSVVDVVDLPAAVELAVDHLGDQLVVFRGDVGLDRLPVLGRR